MQIRQLAALLLLIAGGVAQAASLTLVPANSAVAQNGSITLDLVLDATDANGPHPSLFGGEIIVDFDKTLLSYGGFTLTSGLTFFSPPVLATSGNTQTVTFGFENAPDTVTVGTFSFTAIGGAGGVATLGLTDADDFSGSFINYGPPNTRFYPDFAGAQVNIVPLPAGVWLLGTAVGALALRRRFRHDAA